MPSTGSYANIYYDLGGKTRSKPVSDDYLSRLEGVRVATDPSLSIRITSGGQAPKGSGGPRTGSERHDVDHTGHAHTSDFVLQRNGRDILPSEDKALYSSFIRNAASAGFTGVGHYDWGVHVGGGSEAFWGPSTGSGDADPEFKAAYEEGRRGHRSNGWRTDPKAKAALSFFIGKGWSREQAAGIVGNLIQESRLDTGALNPGDGRDGSNSIGIGQWNADRAISLARFATMRGTAPHDFDTQLEFVQHELETSESGAAEALKAAVTVDEAVAAFIGYERPAGWSLENPRGGHGWDNRLGHAKGLLGGTASLLGEGYAPMSGSSEPRPSIFQDNPYRDQSDLALGGPQRTDADFFRTDAPDDYGVWDAVADSFSSDSFTAWGYRSATEGPIDPAFRITPEDWDAVTREIPEDYQNYVLGAGSEKAFLGRLKYAQDDAERQERLSAMGWEGTAVRFVTGMFDPVTLPMNVMMGGAGASMVRGAARAGKFARVSAGALNAGVSNAALEVAAGEITDAPRTDALMAFGLGAALGGLVGGLSRRGSTSWEAKELHAIGRRATEIADGKSAAPYIVGGDGNMGAASTGVNVSEWVVDDWHVPEAAFGSVRFDVVGQMTTSPDPRTRLLGFLFGEEPVGRKDHGVIADPVSVVRKAHEMRRWGPVEKVVTPARSAWMKEQAVGWNPVRRDEASRQFDSLVWDAVWSAKPDPETSPHVLQAASAYRSFYADYRKDITNPRWESGGYAEPLADVKDNPNYLPLYANHAKIADVANRVPAKTMERFLVRAIMAHSPEIDPKLAGRMARGYWINLRRAGYGIEDQTDLAVSLGDRELFRQAYLKADPEFDPDELDTMFDVLTGMSSKADEAGDKGKPARLKRRTLLDYSFEADLDGFGRLKVRDLFNKDVEFISRRYGRSMSARVALAQAQVRNPSTDELFMDGIRSEADFEKLKNWVREGWQEGAAGDHAKARDGLDNAIANMDHLWAAIHGSPVYGNERQLGQIVRRLKAFQFIRLMNNMGLNQVQETWKLIATLGAKAAFKQLPAIRRMVDMTGRDQPARDALLKELEDVTGFGLEGLFGRHDFALMEDRIGALERGRGVSRLDAALDFGQRVTADISLMRAITTFQQRWAIKAIAQRLHDVAEATATRDADGAVVGFDLGKLQGRERARLATAGIGSEDAKLLFGQLLQYGEREGGKLVGLGSVKWDPQALVKFTHTMNRLTNRIVQQNDVGALAKWMAHPIAQLFTQFRTFVLGAWGKSTLYNIHHFDPATFVLVMGEITFGAATYALRSAGTQLVTEEGREKFWEETTDPVNLVKNGFARSATASILPMMADTALMMTPAGPQFGNARASGQASDAVFGSPTVSAFDDAARFARSVGERVFEGEEMTRSEMEKGFRSLPFANWMPLMGLFGALAGDR